MGISSVMCYAYVLAFVFVSEGSRLTVIPSRPPREYNGFTRPVMKQITLFSHPVLLTHVWKTNLLLLCLGAVATTVTMMTNHASWR